MNRHAVYEQAAIAPVCGMWWVDDDDRGRPEHEVLIPAEDCHPCAGTPLERHVRALRRGIGGDIDG